MNQHDDLFGFLSDCELMTRMGNHEEALVAVRNAEYLIKEELNDRPTADDIPAVHPPE